MIRSLRSPAAVTQDAGTSAEPATSVAEEEKPQERPVKPISEQPPLPGPAAQPRRTWLDLAETRMPALGAQRLPPTATVRAYHKDGSYVPWEAGVLHAICRVHGKWVAVPWCFTFTAVAWLGAGDYRRRLRKFREAGLPGLYRSQLPPLDALTGFSRVWVGFWSAVAWTNLKITRLPMTAYYVLPATFPFWWPLLWSLLRLIFIK
jgi:hypothetical protein